MDFTKVTTIAVGLFVAVGLLYEAIVWLLTRLF
jgi:hypothetical protein